MGTGSFLPENWRETGVTAGIISYDSKPLVKVGREWLLRVQILTLSAIIPVHRRLSYAPYLSDNKSWTKLDRRWVGTGFSAAGRT